MVALELFTEFNCCVVFLGADLKERYYKGAAFQPYRLLSGHKKVQSINMQRAVATSATLHVYFDQLIMAPVINLGG